MLLLLLTFSCSSELRHDWEFCEDFSPQVTVGLDLVEDAALGDWHVSVLADRLDDLLEATLTFGCLILRC